MACLHVAYLPFARNEFPLAILLYQKMFFLFLILLPLCRSLVIGPSSATSLIFPSNNISSFLDLPGSPNSQCVSPGKDTLWNGRVLYADCHRALSAMRSQTARIADDLFAFYTRAGGYEPPRGIKELEWPLPTIVTVGTCQIQVRMFRDFQNGEVPADQGQYIVLSQFAPQQITTWAAIFKEAEGVLRCVKYGRPGWGSEGLKPLSQKPRVYGDIGVFFWSATSPIARKYARVPEVAASGNGNTSLVATA